MFTYKYPRPALTVDCAIFCHYQQNSYILLIKRANPPFQNHWAFPGGFVDMDEDLDTAAYRELEEETGFEDIQLKQFKTYGAIDRDPRGRTVSVVYSAEFHAEELPNVKGADDALKAQWININQMPDLAFDHKEIIKELRENLKI